MTHHKEYEVQLLVGGESRRNQLRNWSRGRLDVVVATPGRLRDLLEDSTSDGDMVRAGLGATQLVRQSLAPHLLAYLELTNELASEQLVLDEADTLLDMGFSADLNFILEKLPKARQTFLFSATVSPAIRDIAKKSLDRNHGVIDCVPANESNTHMHIPQYATVLPSAKDQLPHVLRLLAHDQLTNPGASKAIVFLPTTKLTQLYATFLRELVSSLPMGRRTHIYEIHSKLDQRRRSRSSDSFRQDQSGASILVTSDVSARGVDYPGVTRVIQVNIPGTAEQYIHRVGRTGRGGSLTGRGDLVLLPWEGQWMKELRKVPIQETSVEKIAEDVEAMAAEFDEDPSAYAVARGLSPMKDHQSMRKPARGAFTGKPALPVTIPAFAPRNATMPQAVEDLVTTLDPEAVHDVFSSSLGYYVSKVDSLGMSSMSVVKALQNWAVEAGGLAEAPYVSPSFLAKLGVRSDRAPARNNRSGSFGKRVGSSFSRDRPDRGGASYGGARSSYGGERSSYGGERSSYGGDRSAYGGDRSSGSSGNSGRSSFGDRSSGRTSSDGGAPRRSFGGSDRF
jgi:ATP-dependent RNA helicase MSS116, mitochondrial